MLKNIVPLCKGEVFELSLLIKIYTYIFMIASSILLQNVLTRNLISNLYACCLQPLLCVLFCLVSDRIAWIECLLCHPHHLNSLLSHFLVAANLLRCSLAVNLSSDV